MTFLKVFLVWVLIESIHVNSQTTPPYNEVGQQQLEEDEGLTMESEVLGPLRIWHLVFLVSAFILIIITIVCCCCDFRIPRTRQEIEDGYQKRVDNASYVKYLNDLPTNILKHREGATKRVTEEEPEVRTQRTSRVADSTANPGPKTKLTKGGQVAVATPLASHPNVLEAMSKMKKAARSRPKQTGMAKSMTSLANSDQADDT